MKHAFVGAMFEHLEKEQFCQTLYKIPFVSDIEIIAKDIVPNFGDFYAIVHYSDTDEFERFCIVVKSNGERLMLICFYKTFIIQTVIFTLFLWLHIFQKLQKIVLLIITIIVTYLLSKL